MQITCNARISVHVAHPEPIVANGLTSALRTCSEFEVRNLRTEAAETAGTPAIVVTDYRDAILRCERDDALEAAPTARRSRILVVTTLQREHEIRIALEAGVHGYLMLDCELDELREGVRVLHRGSRYLCMAVSQKMAESLTRDALTQRESEVLRFVAAGVCNKTIASELTIAVGTVKAHVKAIMNKLDASSRTQAARIATQRGLVDVGASAADRYWPVGGSSPEQFAAAH